MKKTLLGMLLCAAGLLFSGSFIFTDIVIDVVDGRFISGETALPLAACDRPITIQRDGEALYAILLTQDGEETVYLGVGDLSITQAAVPYVDAVEDRQAWKATASTAVESCEICGQSMAIGRHYRLACGHYGCKVNVDHLRWCSACEHYRCDGRDHSICEHCDVAMCVHVDLECEYTRNPAPEVYATRTPEGEKEYYTIDPSGVSIYGDASITSSSSGAWTPGKDREKAEGGSSASSSDD